MMRTPIPANRLTMLLPAAALVVSLLGGCAAKKQDMLHFLRAHKHEVSAMEYRVGIPDAVGISAPRILEIDGQAQTLQPDGKINLRLVGETKVVGMTAKEIAAKLEVLLSRYYVDPKVSVRVLGYRSKQYYVTVNEITRTMPYTGRDTLLDAVVGAGVDFRSLTSQVKVIRPAHGETPVRTITVDVNRMVKQGDWSANILLEPNDVVVVPLTPVAWFVKRVHQLVWPISPLVSAYTAPAQMKYIDDAYEDDGSTIYIGGSNVSP